MSTTPEAPTPKLYEALHADPAVAQCSVLSSKLYARFTDILQSDGQPSKDSLVIAETDGWTEYEPEAIVYLGQVAQTDLVVATDRNGGAESRSNLFSMHRGNILINLASFAVLERGPCHYVQLPGEITTIDDDLVITPIDERRKRPILKSMYHAALNYEARKEASFPHEQSLDSAVKRYILGSPEDDEELEKELALNVGRDSLIIMDNVFVNIALSQLLGRYSEHFQTIVDTVMPVTRAKYEKARELLEADPHADLSGVGLSYDEKFVSVVLELMQDDANEQDLAAHIARRFKKVIKMDLVPFQEELLSSIFRYEDALYTRIIKNGYKTEVVTADVEYVLSIETREIDEGARYLQLGARIATMEGADLTHCASYVVEKNGNLKAINSYGDRVDPDPAHLQELLDILKNGTHHGFDPDKQDDVYGVRTTQPIKRRFWEL